MKTILGEGKKWKLNDFVSKRYSFRVKSKKKEKFNFYNIEVKKCERKAWEIFSFLVQFYSDREVRRGREKFSPLCLSILQPDFLLFHFSYPPSESNFSMIENVITK